jgi:hypothetical protein
MRTTINGKTYDTDRAKQVAADDYCSSVSTLYRTAKGEFFLVRADSYLDGRKLAPMEELHEIALEIEPNTARLAPEVVIERKRRLKWVDTVIPMTQREAMSWCIKAFVPECFRGYLLESI